MSLFCEDYETAIKERSRYYSTITSQENRYPGSIGFFDPDTEVFAVREGLFARVFRPHFFTYNHLTGEIQKYRFDELSKCGSSLLEFLNTVRYYSTDRERWPLNRTYYDDLVGEWEVVNKCYMRRKFMCK